MQKQPLTSTNNDTTTPTETDPSPVTTDHQQEEPNHSAPTWVQVTLSTLSAAFGVQNNQARERDFQHGKLTSYIVAGIIFTMLFVGVVAMVVHLVLKNSGL